VKASPSFTNSSLHRSVGPGHDDRGRSGSGKGGQGQNRGVQQKPSLWRRLRDLNAAFEGSWIGDLVGTAMLFLLCWELSFLIQLFAPVPQ
jgi:hypothetical protein